MLCDVKTNSELEFGLFTRFSSDQVVADLWAQEKR